MKTQNNAAEVKKAYVKKKFKLLFIFFFQRPLNLIWLRIHAWFWPEDLSLSAEMIRQMKNNDDILLRIDRTLLPLVMENRIDDLIGWLELEVTTR